MRHNETVPSTAAWPVTWTGCQQANGEIKAERRIIELTYGTKIHEIQNIYSTSMEEKKFTSDLHEEMR